MNRLLISPGLVRFVSKSDSSRILIGEPLQNDLNVGLALRKGDNVQVTVFSGISVLSPGIRTGEIETIGRLLSPLAQSEIGTIRCIGLNVSPPMSTKSKNHSVDLVLV